MAKTNEPDPMIGKKLELPHETYEIDILLGKGGMAKVYSGTQPGSINLCSLRLAFFVIPKILFSKTSLLNTTVTGSGGTRFYILR